MLPLHHGRLYHVGGILLFLITICESVFSTLVLWSAGCHLDHYLNSPSPVDYFMHTHEQKQLIYIYSFT